MPTKNHARIEEFEGRAGVERSEPGGRAELSAGARGRAAEGLPAAAGSLAAWARERGLPGGPEEVADRLGRSRELPRELVDEALEQARVRRAAAAALPDEVRERLTDELIDELLAGRSSEAEIVGPDGLLGELTKRLIERAMAAELTEHLGYEPHAEPPGGAGNTRNGSTPKTLQTRQGPVRIERPRDRNATFEPRIVKNGQRRF